MLTIIGNNIFAGLKDSFNVWGVLLLLSGSNCIRKKVALCFALNTAVYVASYLLLYYIVEPIILILQSCLFYVLGDLFSGFDGLASIFLNVVWGYPVYIVSFLINCLWYRDIALEAFKTVEVHRTVRRSVSNRVRGILRAPDLLITAVAKELYRFAIVTNFILSIYAIRWILQPLMPLNLIFMVVGWAMLIAFFSFEYRWNNNGISGIDQKIEYLESHWAYFLGFGMIPALISLGLDEFTYSWVYSTAFPLYILMSVSAKPQKAPFRLYILYPVKMTHLIISKTFDLYEYFQDTPSKVFNDNMQGALLEE